MEFEAVKAWLEKFNARRVRNFRILGVTGICLSPLALVVAAGLVFAVLHLLIFHVHEARLVTQGLAKDPATPHFAQPNEMALLGISVAVIPFMFIANKFAPRGNLLDQHIESGDYATFTGHYTAKSKVQLQMLLWTLFAGPRLLNWGLDSFREIKLVKQMDTHSCGALLWLLVTNYKKVPYETIQAELPWLNLDATLLQLLAIEGVVALPTTPAGLSLTQDLRDMIRGGNVD